MSNKRQKYSAEFKAKVALTAIKNEENNRINWPSDTGGIRHDHGLDLKMIMLVDARYLSHRC